MLNLIPAIAKCMQIYQHKWNSITSFYIQFQWSELSKADLVDILMHARSLYTCHTHVRVRLTEKSYKRFKYKVYVVYYKYACCFRQKKLPMNIMMQFVNTLKEYHYQ